nr:MAG TPA: hypothetical protein [Caudoviricetes sp.]
MFIIICGLIIFLVVKIIKFLYFYFCEIKIVKKHVIIKFNDFVKYYQINPNKWELRNMRVGYTPKTVDSLNKSTLQNFLNLMDLYKDSPLWEKEREDLLSECLGKRFYRFSFIDSFRYKKWHENKLKEERIKEEQEEAIKQSKKHREDIIALLEGVQADIDKLRKQSQDEINQAVEVIKDVSERVG